jgi:hypothetical protein
LAFHQAYISHLEHYWKFFLLQHTQVLRQYRLCKADHAYLTYLMLQQHLSHLNCHKLDHAKFKELWLDLVFLLYSAPICIETPIDHPYPISIDTSPCNRLVSKNPTAWKCVCWLLS